MQVSLCSTCVCVGGQQDGRGAGEAVLTWGGGKGGSGAGGLGVRGGGEAKLDLGGRGGQGGNGGG